MIKKICALVFAMLTILSATALASQPKVLGIERDQWNVVFADLQRKPPEDFLDKVAEYAKFLKQKRDADHFEKLGSDSDPRQRTKENPLWDRKRKHRYVTSLNLDKTDFVRLTDIMRGMQEKFMDDEIAQFLPYIALCLNEGMRANDIRFYINRDAFMGTPIDLSIDRLYRELRIELGEI